MKKVLLAAALVASCGVASAQGYAGALVGLSKISTDCYVGASCDDSDTGYKLYGGYEVAPNVAVEVGYTSFGKASITDSGDVARLKGSAISVVGAFRYAFTPELMGVARLGLASVTGKYSDTLGGSDSESKIKLYSGLGLEYSMTKDFKIVGAFDLTSIDLSGTSSTAYLFGVGAQMSY
jgi:OOP family OmpA-OmpF porin